jgi:septum formation protein
MINERLKSYNIILASGSPRRQELLRELGIEFEVLVNNDLEEIFPSDLDQYEIPVHLARLKSESVPGLLPDNSLLITADTIVWLNGNVLNKPIDRDDAIRILGDLSGNQHEVVTGVCFRTGEKMHSFYASTLVWFAKITREEIMYYVDRYKPYDKAGAYGIQEWIGYIGIEKIEGSYYNVMGLPVQKVYHELRCFFGD